MFQHFFRYLSQGWSLDPVAIVLIGIPAILYWRGHHSLLEAKRRGSGKGLVELGRRARRFWAAMALLVLTFMSPIDYFSGQYFWMHMIQHILLMVYIPPLLVLSDPWYELLRGVPVRYRATVGRAVSHLLGSSVVKGLSRRIPAIWAANVIFNFAMWFWHTPAMYNLTLENLGVHYLEHFSFFVFGTWFWFTVLDPNPHRRKEHILRRVGHVWVASMSGMILAMLLGLSFGPWYTFYAHVPGRTLSLLADQQWGAGIMWVFGNVPFFLVGVRLLQQWLDNEEREDQDLFAKIFHGVLVKSVGRSYLDRNPVSKFELKESYGTTISSLDKQ